MLKRAFFLLDKENVKAAIYTLPTIPTAAIIILLAAAVIAVPAKGKLLNLTYHKIGFLERLTIATKRFIYK
jgi:hypothetical protein